MENANNQEKITNYFKAFNKIFEADITKDDKLVFLYLCRCSNNNKFAFPSYKTIAEKCSISRKTAITSVKNLLQNNLLIKKNRDKNSNLYFILPP
jgi:predicted transcriptional regulator